MKLSVNSIVLVVSIILSLISICLCCYAVFIGNYNPYSKSASRLSSMVNKEDRLLCRLPYVKSVVDMLSEKLGFILGNRTTAFKLAFALVHLYLVLSLLLIVTSFSYTRVWYMLIVNFLVSTLAPLILVRLLIMKFDEALLKQLPKSLDELESAFYRTDKLKSALEIAVPNMPSNSRKVFGVLMSDIKSNELDGIEKFKKSFNSPYIDSLAIVLTTYVSEGGSSITQHIQHLSSMIRSEIVNSTQTSSKLAKYKFLAILTIITVPVFIFFSVSISPDMYEYYTGTVAGTTLSSSVIVATIVYYLIIELIERL